MNRYYVFRKRDGESRSTKTQTKKSEMKSEMKGGKTGGKKAEKQTDSEYNFSDMEKYRIPDMSNYNSQNSLLNSIHKIMVSHSMIPKSVKVREFVEHQDAEFRNDVEADEEYIRELASKFTIDHDVEGKVQRVMNGVNVYILERDCNNFYDVSFVKGCSNKKEGRAIVLMKEGLLYKPMMRREEKGTRGMFKLSDPLIKHFESTGDEL